jgi:hypothetical protein
LALAAISCALRGARRRDRAKQRRTLRQ